MLEFLRRWIMREHQKSVDDYKQASDRLSEESRKLRRDIEDCSWDQIVRGLTQDNGSTRSRGNRRDS